LTDDGPILASQRAYYEERADDYADESKPPDRKVRGLLAPELGTALIDELQPTGHVLELACGTGIFTREIVRFAETVTAVDASPRMLAINRERVNHANVTYIEADLFSWEPGRTYDVVFFGFWLSHVPPDRFDGFWDLVRRCLGPGGRVAFVDEDDRTAEATDVTVVDRTPVAMRTLADGRSFEIVKVFWRPDELRSRLAANGWNIEVRRVGETSMYGASR
jgi:demethylmenaquinone methyltransferase/2-methoxy-6-polyprenyl-1,4-benzoquinol methylase